ncbi:BTB/POZ domain-containing adapter for CUL3-mediated RhoA degradation protein 1 isoform X1 [Hemicordylus capensis]|uniref:BTB/POZ domain-containing adapter for CUL3-mediated RhoA degradation protein 1 isoform X1 n=2 Tax=Hemicordylus capensis TaxID=884348 RepID=UPI002302170D|nr:BTB/POZ domain-containing adapter for CUL3-mediated RhoA degradation protein 1 isoform X1 [Hemicordylus capensis]
MTRREGGLASVVFYFLPSLSSSVRRGWDDGDRGARLVAMSAEATADPALPADNCAPLVPIQQRRDGGGGVTGVTFDLKPLNPSSKYVKLNVGGSLHYTTVQTLTKQDTMLKAMFSGRMEVLTDSEGWILIDRSGRHFGTILNYLRDGSVSLPESQRELEEVLSEARYYLIQGLAEDCQLALQQKSEAYDPLCHIPMVTSPKEEQQIISSCSKPVVKLLHNRSNNKYSYTSNSDDNLLKNIELFDKLALRFNGRVLFIKDVLGDEICCWSFYGQGRKIAEVCCTSIVYATEKKQTKVEFPEARIFEETLNILIYETPRVPDKALLEATGGVAGGGGGPLRAGDDEDGREHRVRRIHVRRHIMHDERPHGHQAVFKD